MRRPLVMISLIITFSLAIGFVYGKTIYSVSDEPGIDRIIGAQADPTLMSRIDILEAWLDVNGGVVEVYIKLNTSNFPDFQEVRNSYRYIVKAYLKSGDKIKDFEAGLAINPGVGIVACSLEYGDDKRETIGVFEFLDSYPLILKIRCSFEGESFDAPPKNNMLFRVSASVNPATIGDETASLIDNLVLEVENGESETPSVPDETSQKSEESLEETEEEGGGSELILIIVIAAIGLAAVALYTFMKMRG